MTRRLALGGLALTAVLTATGCGGDTDTPDAGASASPSAASASPSEADTSAAPTPSTTASESTDSGGAAAGDTYADVAPATGPVLTGESSTVNVPADWAGEEISENGLIALGPTSDYSVTLNETTAGVSGDLAKLAKDTIRFRSLEGGKQLDDVVIAGQPAYHVTGTDEVFQIPTDIFGFSLDGTDYDVAISTPTDVPQAEREALFGTVLASFRLTGS